MTPEAKKRITQRILQINIKNTVVITNGYDNDDFLINKQTVINKDAKCFYNIIHTGTLQNRVKTFNKGIKGFIKKITLSR